MLTAITMDNAKHNNLTFSSVCMDVKRSFDNLYLKRLLNTLIKKDRPTPLRIWLYIFLTNQTAYLAFDGQKKSMSKIQTGISQESHCHQFSSSFTSHLSL